MVDRALIVARTSEANIPQIAKLFAESDDSDLPTLLGVRHRSLFSYHDLYFHYVEFDGDHKAALAKAAGRDDFKELSVRLRPLVDPYDPSWRSPADALSAEFYTWTPQSGPEIRG
jgi:hypothetical protein